MDLESHVAIVILKKSMFIEAQAYPEASSPHVPHPESNL